MTCDDVELELSGLEPSAEALAHAQACGRCARSAEALGLARLPALSARDEQLLAALPATAAHAAAALAPARGAGRLRSASALLLAAGLGALVASGALLATRPEPVTRVETVPVAAPALLGLSFSDDEPNLSDDEVFFEVGWPSPTEGDL